VRRGLFPDRDSARRAIESGTVLVAGSVALGPGRLVSPAEPLALRRPASRFVGRGGEKLDAALDRFAIEVDGRAALDAGASTGGFTDALLQRGAAKVFAVDVGHGQLDHRLRGDPRVVVFERTNIRDTTLESLGADPFPVVTADLSFISLRAAAPALVALARPGADMVVLAKPQFEATRAEASLHRGVIRDVEVRARVLIEVASAFASLGAAMMGAMVSPLTGADGNVEFLLHLVPGGTAAIDPDELRTLAGEGAP
jgi:23S rRNA (cytidine1920-2'-O)/16S rRNA (cytidine1409-2'-O)-methyltransferase